MGQRSRERHRWSGGLGGGCAGGTAAAVLVSLLAVGGCAPPKRAGETLAATVRAGDVRTQDGDRVTIAIIERSGDGERVAWYLGRAYPAGDAPARVDVPIDAGRLRADAEFAVSAILVREGRVVARGRAAIAADAASAGVTLAPVAE